MGVDGECVCGCWGGEGDPDGATDVLAAAALLCRQTGSSELGLSALPCYSLFSSYGFCFALFALFCSFEVTSAKLCSNSTALCSCSSPPTLAMLCWWGARWHSEKAKPSFNWKTQVQDPVSSKDPPR